MEFSTLQTTLPVSDTEHLARARKVAERLADLRAHGRYGYTLANTLTVTGTNYLTIIDTLHKGPTQMIKTACAPPTSPLMTPDQTSDALGISLADLVTMRSGNNGPNFHRIGLGLVRYNTADVMRWRASRAVA